MNSLSLNRSSVRIAIEAPMHESPTHMADLVTGCLSLESSSRTNCPIWANFEYLKDRVDWGIMVFFVQCDLKDLIGVIFIDVD